MGKMFSSVSAYTLSVYYTILLLFLAIVIRHLVIPRPLPTVGWVVRLVMGGLGGSHMHSQYLDNV